MAQLLKVIQDPSIVQNVPTTSLEQLQLATEAKAEQMAKARANAIVSALVATDPIGDRQSWNQFDDQATNQGYDLSGSPDRLPRGSKAYGIGDGVDPKLAYTMGTPGGNQAPGPLMDPGQQAITAALTPKPVVRIVVPSGNRPFEGSIGSINGRGFLSGNPGQTDWSVANQGMGGLGGLVSQSTLAPTAAPAPNAGFNLLSLFGGGYTPTVGYNGTTSVTSGELAGANKGFGGENAVMPDSMNSKRWLTEY